jgi:predicted XRE-type DNA-binding protein
LLVSDDASNQEIGPARKIVWYAKNRNYSQAQLVKILRERQPRACDLLRGKIASSSLEALVNYAEALDVPRG